MQAINEFDVAKTRAEARLKDMQAPPMSPVFDEAMKSARESAARREREERGIPEPELPPVPNVFDRPAVEKTEVALPAEIAARIADLRTATEAYARINGLITEATRSHGALNADYERAFADLATSEAAITLDGAAADSALRKAVLKHREALLLHEARLSGLQKRLQAARSEVDSAMRNLDQTRNEWRETEIRDSKAAIKEAMDEFFKAVASHYAAALAHGDRRLQLELSQSSLTDPETHENRIEEIRFWKQNATMCETANSRASVHSAVQDAIASARILVLNPSDLSEV